MAAAPLNAMLARPELLLAHGQRYAALVSAELSLAARDAQRRVAWLLLGIALAVAGLTLLGVAALLHVSTPQGLPLPAWVVPAVALLAAVLAARRAQHGGAPRPFHALKQELATDAQWLGMAALLASGSTGETTSGGAGPGETAPGQRPAVGVPT